MESETTISADGQTMAGSLLEHADFVRSLARRLVRDACEAEDLEQDAWLAALQRRAALSVDPRGWLARVLRTRAGNRRREESRRRRREGLTARGEGEQGASATELAERMELRQRIVGAVLALDDPYRSTVLLRYESDLPPSAIARRTGVSIATVKTRLRRALAQLRARLDREAGGDGRRWLAGLAPLLDESTTTSTAAGFGVSGVMVVAAALVFAVVLGLGIRAWTDMGGRDVSEPVVPAVAAEARDSGDNDGDMVYAADSTAQRAVVEEREFGSPVIPVRIVDAFTREPVVGASLWYAAAIGDASHADEVCDALPTGGRRLTSDERGLVSVPTGTDTIAVYARHDELHARTFLEPDDLGTVEMGVRPSRMQPLRVRVLDADGVPVPGVGVWLRYTLHDSDNLWKRRDLALDGTVVLGDLDELADGTKWGTTWQLRPDRPGARAYVEVDPRAIPLDPVMLRLPPSGTLVLSCVDERGEPVASLPGVWLTRAGPGPGAPGWSTFAGPVRNGELVIRGVGLGLNLRVRIPAGPGLPRQVTANVTGPRQANEVVRETIRLVAEGPVLRGRLVGPDGTPLAAREFRYAPPRLRSADLPPPPRTGVTDDEGCFTIPAPRARGEGRQLCFLVPGADGEATWSGRWTVPWRFRSNEVEMGDISLAPPDRIVRGRVVDESGTAIPAARVEVSMTSAAPVEEEEESEGSGQLKSLGYGGESAPSPPKFDVDTDEHGRFKVLVAAGDADLTLTAAKPGYGPEAPVSCDATGEDVVLSLPRTCAIVGSIALPEGLEAGRLRVGVAGEKSPRRKGVPPHRHTLDAGGHFRLRRLPGGTHTVQIHLDGLPNPILEVAGVHVAPGQLASDPRLQAIDVAPAVRVFDLAIIDAAGQPVPQGMIVLTVPDDPDIVERGIDFREGRGRFVTPRGVFQAELNAEGYRTLFLSGLQEMQGIVMRPGIPVQLVLPDELPLPPSPAHVSVQIMAPEGGEDNDGHPFNRLVWSLRSVVGPLRFEDDHLLDLRLSMPGVWSMWWRVEFLDEQGTVYVIEVPTTIDVRDADELQKFVVSPDAGEYADALAQIR